MTVPYFPSVGMINNYPTTAGTGNPVIIGAAPTCPTPCVPVCQVPVPSGPCANVSPDAACISSQLAALRAEVRGVAIEAQGQMLLSRMNQLQWDTMAFIQSFSANPNMPGAQIQAQRLLAQANALNQDISGFNQMLTMVPNDQRQFLAPSLNTYTTAYWNPALQRFANFNNQFLASAANMQPLYASNAWLQPWQTSFSSSLGSIASAPQTYASARWWTGGPVVLGSVETYPTAGSTYQAGSYMMMPNGSAVYVPAGSVPMMSTGTTGMMTTTPGAAY